MTECSRNTCFAPEIGCDLGHLDLSKCPAWRRETAPTADKQLGADEVLLPWSGGTLGLVDLGFVAGRAKPMVVGVIGPQNAGKTTLLGSWYLLFGRGLDRSANRQFAGSYTLEGWEAVANALRWSPGNQPHFPPHTSSRSGRAPGLLHLAFRCGDERIKDYVLTDAPGEWFQKWAINRDATEGQGAKWVAEHADVFLMIADREALSGANMGSARGALQLLAQRLAGERRCRPVALVWTKADVAISAEMEGAVREAVMVPMPDAVEFSVSIKSKIDGQGDAGSGFLELFDWALNIRRGPVSLPEPYAVGTDPLFVFGRR
jgi:Double-GTPase 2